MTMTIQQVAGKVEAYGRSEGKGDGINVDAFVCYPERRFFAVADGVGRKKSGAVAAEVAVETMRHYVAEVVASMPEDADLVALFAEGIEKVNDVIYAMTANTKNKVATTLCSIYFAGGKACYAHVGDSRIYRCRGGAFEQITRDHSLHNKLVESGALDTGRSGVSFDNVITRAVGALAEVDPDVALADAEEGDIYLLCSDGTSDNISNDVMHHIIAKGGTAEATVDALVAAAKASGGDDDITAMVVRYG